MASTPDDYKLRLARRALQRIKEHLGLEATEKLIQPDIDESNIFWRRVMAENTTGEFKPARVELAIKGLPCRSFYRGYPSCCIIR
jgi:hypothetical protein